MMTLLAHGTEHQKEKYLKPLLNGEKRICYSMTEKAAGADATGMQTRAVKDGNENYVLNGEKWFSSAASRYSTFIVELPNPGYRIVRDIETMAVHGPLSEVLGGGHSEVEIKDLVVPAEDLLGGEGNGFNMGQHRLAYGRLRHGMHNVSMAQRALDLATAHVVKRETFGKLLKERQGVQWMLADCAAEIYKARLMLLHIAYKAEKGADIRQENSIAKIFLAQYGASGGGHGDPAARRARLQPRYAACRMVHRWTVGRNVIKAFERDGTTAAACGGDLL
ncbi:hypothetical protein GTA08_BOTSDO14324 [Botryosphaeria dothidea]|uniref:Acyl-dehydrogenase protein n=1 Tax=Botryosphaeria dothidea TaxID=55169 RepID=A0A8H4MX46_9PEZI|nr:hypothetical protein GTA08_BOTSDO14324 [Botryosphaeria dothidea]